MILDLYFRDVVITILSDETQGSEAMRVCVAKNGAVCKEGEEVEVTTPMRMLIEVMPGKQHLNESHKVCYLVLK